VTNDTGPMWQGAGLPWTASTPECSAAGRSEDT
jgi:hypothetical protein